MVLNTIPNSISHDHVLENISHPQTLGLLLKRFFFKWIVLKTPHETHFEIKFSYHSKWKIIYTWEY